MSMRGSDASGVPVWILPWNQGFSLRPPSHPHPTKYRSSMAGKSGKPSPVMLDEIRSNVAKGKLINKRFIEAGIISSDASARLGLKDGRQLPSASTEMLNASVLSTTNGLASEIVRSQKSTKALVLRVDCLKREIDEHGNVVNVTKPHYLSTLKVNINKQKKYAFQILKAEVDMNHESNPFFDTKMGINMTKIVRPKRMNFQFVEEGKRMKEAEYMKMKMKFGELQAKEDKAKQAQSGKAKGASDTNPNLIEVAERVSTKDKQKDPIPEVEWCRLNPPVEQAPPPPQPLKLTKKEQKKLCIQRRLAREKEKQEMVRLGLIEPPKPKVKMNNLMKVLGSEATQYPTKLEKENWSAAAEREQAHIDRNIARKLTPAECCEKKERKLFDDPNNVETLVSVYKINDLSHPKARFKIDVNARENRLTGCAVISECMNMVVVEGGRKSVRRYEKLMLHRINWPEAVKEDDDEEKNDDKAPNKCALVWQGNVARPSFSRFFVHESMSEAGSRKYLADAGVAHYWDLAVNFADDNQ